MDIGWLDDIGAILGHPFTDDLKAGDDEEDNKLAGTKRDGYSDEGDSDEGDSDDDKDDSTAGKSAKGGSSSKDTKEKSKEQREKRKDYCDKLIVQAKHLSEAALSEADRKEETFNALKEKKQQCINLILEVLNHLCVANLDKATSRTVWESILEDKFELIYPRHGYLLYKEESKQRRKSSNDSVGTTSSDSTISDDYTRLKITKIDDLIKAVFSINFFLSSLARLDSNLLSRVTFQPRLKEFLLNGQTASAKVLYTSTNAFLCGGQKEVTIQGNILVKFAENSKIGSIELFYNKNEFDLIFAESFGSAYSRLTFIDYSVQEIDGQVTTTISPRFAISDLNSTSDSYQLEHRSKTSQDAFKEVEEWNTFNKQNLSKICGRDVETTFIQSKPELFYVEHDDTSVPKGKTNLLIQAMPYFIDDRVAEKMSTKMSMSRIFEALLDRIHINPNKIIWMVYKCHHYDNILIGLMFVSVKNIVSIYSSWLENIKDFIKSCFKSEVTSRFNALQDIFQILRKILGVVELTISSDTAVNTFEILQEFLLVISQIDAIINAELREDEYKMENLTVNDISPAEQDQLMDMLISEEQQFIRAISQELDKFFTQIRTTQLLEQVIKLLKVVTNDSDANSLQHFINLCWTRHSNPVIQGLQESLRSYVLQKSSHETSICVSEIIAIDPAYAEAYSKRAAINFGLNDTAAAFNDIESAVTIDPLHYGAWCTKGIMEMKLSSFDAAIKSFSRAIEINPCLQTKSIKSYLDQCIKLRQQQNSQEQNNI